MQPHDASAAEHPVLVGVGRLPNDMMLQSKIVRQMPPDNLPDLQSLQALCHLFGNTDIASLKSLSFLSLLPPCHSVAR